MGHFWGAFFEKVPLVGNKKDSIYILPFMDRMEAGGGVSSRMPRTVWSIISESCWDSSSSSPPYTSKDAKLLLCPAMSLTSSSGRLLLSAKKVWRIS